MKKFRMCLNFHRPMANTVDAFIPELWSRESLAILEENIVAAGLVHRAFENEIKDFGDTVKTRRPSELDAIRKGVNDNVTIQDVSTVDVDVKLNQHVHTSFIIKDSERSKSFADLVATYLRPAMLGQARYLDQVVLGQYVHFIVNSYAGHLGGLTDSTAKAYVLEARQKMNTNKAYMQGRNMIVTPSSETELLKLDLFNSAEKVGDDGTALREASLGRKLGFNFFLCQNMPTIVDNSMAKKTGAINNTSGYAVGSTTLTVDGFTGAVTSGSYVTIAGDMTPHRIASHTETLSNTTQIVLATGLRTAVVNDAVVTAYTPGAVNEAGNYAAGYDGAIVVDGFTASPQVGQMISFGTASAQYTVIQGRTGAGVATPSTTAITLDRPLDAAISNDDTVNVGPPGNYNFGFHQNALALVVRPLALPQTGALSGIATYKNLSMRTVITYDGNKQGHLVTLDMLCGIAVLDTDLGVVMHG